MLYNLLVLGFSRETKPIGDIYDFIYMKEISNKELAHTITEAEKSSDLQSEGLRTSGVSSSLSPKA